MSLGVANRKTGVEKRSRKLASIWWAAELLGRLATAVTSVIDVINSKFARESHLRCSLRRKMAVHFLSHSARAI